MKIILLNGPPRCGKDTIARFLLEHLREGNDTVRFLRMSHPIKRAFAGFVNAPIDEFGAVGNNWEENKDVPSALLNGKTYRQWQIDFSEHMMKPLYGEDVFGRVFAADIAHNPADYVLVPDCGFSVEAKSLLKHLPDARLLLFRVHRPGCDFSGDSRSYIHPYGVHVSEDIYNDSSLEALRDSSMMLLDWPS